MTSARSTKINPEEVEARYGASPYIKELCVLYPRRGKEAGALVAVIVPDEDLLRAHKHVNIGFKIRWELDTYSQKLPAYKRIRGFVLTPESLPRTPESWPAALICSATRSKRSTRPARTWKTSKSASWRR